MNAKARSWFEDVVYTPPQSADDKLKNGTSEDIVACAQNRARAINSAMPEFLGGGAKDRASPVWMR